MEEGAGGRVGVDDALCDIYILPESKSKLADKLLTEFRAVRDRYDQSMRQLMRYKIGFGRALSCR